MMMMMMISYKHVSPLWRNWAVGTLLSEVLSGITFVCVATQKQASVGTRNLAAVF
jgi:hypothetical protein